MSWSSIKICSTIGQWFHQLFSIIEDYKLQNAEIFKNVTKKMGTLASQSNIKLD